jgi:ketosteroid isomerase-like protein
VDSRSFCCASVTRTRAKPLFSYASLIQTSANVGARPLFAENLIAFTFANFVTGRDATEKEQWRNMWGTIDHFRCRLNDMNAIISADRLTAVGMAVFDSTGYRENGTPYGRPERATVVFGRSAIGEDWVALRTHFFPLPRRANPLLRQ